MTKMLLARFALNQKALEGCQVAKLPFAYVDALDDLLGFVLSSDSKRKQKKRKWEWNEYPPFERLNEVLVGSAPSLIHGFSTYGETQKWTKSELSTKPRYALALTSVEGSPVWVPDIDRINDLVFTWADQWARETFKVDELRGGAEKLDAMRKAIYSVTEPWQFTNAAQLWKQHVDEEDTLVWSALSSVLSSLFVHRMAGEVFELNDGDKIEKITWQLTQEGNNKLAVVSAPFRHGKQGEDHRRGLVGYKLEFVMQTLAGGSDPWIGVFVSRRRFADRRVSTKNYDRDVTILMSSMTDRKPGWKTTPTWVRFKVGGWLKKEIIDTDQPAIDEDKLLKIFWRNHSERLWEAWRARPLVDPAELFKTGGRFNFNDNEDRYLILHAEGMEYSPGTKHGAESGTSLGERKLLMQHIHTAMSDVLTPDIALQVDDRSTLTVEQIFEQQLWALYTIEDMKTSTRAIPIERNTELSAQAQRHYKRRRVTDAALSMALADKPLNIIIATEELPARQVLEGYLREALFLDDTDPLPSCICVTPLQIPHDLNTPPGDDIPERIVKEKLDEVKRDFQAQWETKVRAWKTKIQNAVVPGIHNLALVELRGRSDAITRKYAWRKSAARRGIYEAGASSQFVLSIPPKMAGDPTYFAPFVPAARSRVINAVRDAIVRQTGLLYGSLPELYRYAGLDESRSEQLVVVALYRFRQGGSQKVDFPFAVELHPDGRVMVVLPDISGKPQPSIPYIEAGIRLAEVFCLPMQKHFRAVNFRVDRHDTRLMEFAHSVISISRPQPTLILMEADGWRQNYLHITTNPSISKDSVFLSGKRYTPKELPHTALLRVRDAGTLNETPQFIAGNDPAWDGAEIPTDSDAMMGAIDVRGAMMHFYSVSRQSATTDEDQDNEDFTFSDGGDTAFRHQKIVEMLPWFAQNDADRIVFCRIAHMLRFTPSWNRGNTVRSLPLHLAHALAKNVAEVFLPLID